MPLPERLQQAARHYVIGDDEDDLELALEVIQGFGIPRHDGEVKRQVTLLCVLATRRVLFGWTELGCAGDQPAAATRAAWDWIHSGRISVDWSAHCVPAPAIHDGRTLPTVMPVVSNRLPPRRPARSTSSRPATRSMRLWSCVTQEGPHWKVLNHRILSPSRNGSQQLLSPPLLNCEICLKQNSVVDR